MQVIGFAVRYRFALLVVIASAIVAVGVVQMSESTHASDSDCSDPDPSRSDEGQLDRCVGSSEQRVTHWNIRAWECGNYPDRCTTNDGGTTSTIGGTVANEDGKNTAATQDNEMSKRTHSPQKICNIGKRGVRMAFGWCPGS